MAPSHSIFTRDAFLITALEHHTPTDLGNVATKRQPWITLHQRLRQTWITSPCPMARSPARMCTATVGCLCRPRSLFHASSLTSSVESATSSSSPNLKRYLGCSVQNQNERAAFRGSAFSFQCSVFSVRGSGFTKKCTPPGRIYLSVSPPIVGECASAVRRRSCSWKRTVRLQ